MSRCIETYLSKYRSYDVVDFGSRISDGQKATHRELFAGYDIRYTGVDIDPGRNVDVVMRKPYRIPLKSNSADVIVTGQVFEHVPFFWASFMELARVVRPEGFIFMTVPSRGHTHDVWDCWRYYPDGMRALAAVSRLKLIDGRMDEAPVGPDGRRYNYAGIDAEKAYWGDTVGVFQKPIGYRDLEVLPFRTAAVWWANRVGGLSHVPGTVPRHPGRRKEVLVAGGPSGPTTAVRLRRAARRHLPEPVLDAYRSVKRKAPSSRG